MLSQKVYKLSKQQTSYLQKIIKWWVVVGRGSTVGIAIRYELDSPGIESRWGRDFQHPFGPTLGPTQPPVQWVPGTAGAWR
jgi:hypothetical protein